MITDKAASVTGDEVLAEARKRFAYDAEFHEKVVRSVQIVALDCYQNSGERLTRNEDGAATVAAAVTLLLAERAAHSAPYESKAD